MVAHLPSFVYSIRRDPSTMCLCRYELICSQSCAHYMRKQYSEVRSQLKELQWLGVAAYKNKLHRIP